MRPIIAVFLLAACKFTHGSVPDAGGGSPADVGAIDAADPPIDGALDAALDASQPAASCSDTMQNGSETDVDCGGSCAPCAVGLMCGVSGDCAESVCAGICRHAYSCAELHQAQAALGDAAYTIDPDDANGAAPIATYCDMTVDGGGWTLVGKVDGRFNMHAAWLVSTVNASAMQTPTIGSNTYACVDAIALAVDRSTEVRLSNSTRTRWVKWPLPAARATGTFWRHTVGYTTVNAATQSSVTVTGWNGTTGTCYQNEFGVMNWDMHGGAYPYTARNTAGNTLGGDLCMAVGTQTSGTADGFGTNGNQFDAPIDESAWPNANYNVTPHVAVWLR